MARDDELAHARSVIEHLGTHDPLTNLANRSLLRRHLDRLEHLEHLEPPDRGADPRRPREDDALGRRHALLAVDLDHFGRVNDDHGHDCGDEMLVHVAERLLAVVTTDDLVARTGGDEFAVVLGARDPAALHGAVTAVRRALNAPMWVHGRRLRVAASMGVVEWAPGSVPSGPGELMRRAGLALQRAKAEGRDALVRASSDLLREEAERRDLLAELEATLEQGVVVPAPGARPAAGLGVDLAPQVDLATGRIVGVGARPRWRHPRLGPIEGDRLAVLARECRLDDALGDLVLRTACVRAVELQRELARPLTLAVDVGHRPLRRRDWLVDVARALADSGLPPAQLEIGITSTHLVEDDARSRGTLHNLRALGVRLVVAEFGTGFGTLSRLIRLPVDVVRVERCFVEQIGAGQRGETILESMIAMGRALGLGIVADGVSTPEQERWLQERGCPLVQGPRYGDDVQMGARGGLRAPG